jgi:hypothetical protein
MAQPAYPATRYQPSHPLGLASRGERARLSASALKGFFRLVEHWQLRDEDAKQLLGGITAGPYYKMKRHPSGRVLDTDRLLRISYLLGIFSAVNVLHVQPPADEWIKLPNANRIFGGGTPLAYMIKGGLPAMITVRRLLDARQAGF